MGRGSRAALLSCCSNGFTYHWGIPEALDGLENATSNRSHGEGTSTVIHNPPGTAKKHRDGNAASHRALLGESHHPNGWHRTQKKHEEAQLPTLLHPRLLSSITSRGNAAAKPAGCSANLQQEASDAQSCLNSPHVAQRCISIMENLCRIPAHNWFCPNDAL